MADVSELLRWLRNPENKIPDTDDIAVLENFREKVASAFELIATNKRISEAFEQYVRTPKAFKKIASEKAIIDKSQSFDTSWIARHREKRGEPYWNRLRQFLLDERKRPLHLVNMLDDESENVLNHLGDPDSVKLERRGLVVGYVQSGKTANMAALMAKAADAGYKLIIVFAGVLDTLRQQTQLRFDQELLGADNPDENWAHLPFVKRYRESEYPNWRPGTHARSNDPKEGEIKEGKPKPDYLKKDLGPLLFVIKKTKVRVNLLREMLERSAKEFEGIDYYPLPTLVIDDESDQATINIKANKAEVAATNEAIRKLLNVLRVNTYVGYTATPFANLFVDPYFRDTKLGRDLFPKDFIIPLRAPTTYFGAKQLFGLSEDRDPDRENPGFPIFRSIDPKEINNIKTSSIKSLRRDLPKLGEAIDAFILSCAGRIQRGEKQEDMSMLVHPSSYTEIQNKFAHPIVEEVKKIKALAKTGPEWAAYLGRLKKLWDTDFDETTRVVSDLISRSNEKLKPEERLNKDEIKKVNFQDIEGFLVDVVGDMEVKVLHSGSKDYLQYHDRLRPKRYIVVGGNKLSRGLTIEGLTVSYFIRNSSSYDTLLQMGRWFGYREKYVDLTRLYLTATARNNFAELAFVEMDLREQFRKYALEGIRPLDMPPRILQVPSMAITARNRMGNAIKLEADFGDSVNQQMRFEFNDPEKIVTRNAHWINFLKSIGSPARLPKEGNLIWNEYLTTEKVIKVIGPLELGNLNTKLFSEYLVEKMNASKWVVSVAGKEGGTQVGPFEFGSWRGHATLIDRTIKSALQDTTTTVSSPTDLDLIENHLRGRGLDPDEFGYLVLYFLNSDPNELWRKSSGSAPETYLANIPQYIVAPVFRIPKLGKGAIKVGIGQRSEEEIERIYREEEAIDPDEE